MSGQSQTLDETAILPLVKVKDNFGVEYDVIFYNDDKTTFDFVITQLQTNYEHDLETAQSVANKIHNSGKAIVGTYFFEIATSKKADTDEAAQAEGFPLVVKLEPAMDAR